MPINNFLLPGAKTTPAYEVANSVIFNDNDSPSMFKTPSSGGNQTTWTFSTWFKRGNLGSSQWILDAYDGSNDEFHIYVSSGNAIGIYTTGGGFGNNLSISTSNLVRDVGAWYHLVVRCDTTQGTASNRLRIYLNGTEATYGTYNNFTENGQGQVSESGTKHWIGRRNAGDYFDGYFAEMVLVDGSSLAPTSFGEFDSDSPGIWKAIDVSGLTFGTNGFYLDFEDSSNLGNDANGGTDWTEVNLAATDQSTDTCTNNFATLNPLVKGNTAFTFLQGNIQVDSGNNWGHGVGTIGLASGKWYWEVDNITASSNVFFGICNEFNLSHLTNDSTPYSEAGLMLYFQDGRRTIDGTSSEGEYNAYGTTHGFALDLDSGTRTIKFYRDNSLEGTENLTANFPAGEFVFPILMMSASSNACGVDFNFGGTIASALASAESDENGYGSFEFAPPSGYYAICTKNIAEYG